MIRALTPCLLAVAAVAAMGTFASSVHAQPGINWQAIHAER